MEINASVNVEKLKNVVEFSWNPSSCVCEFKKKAAHLLVEKCKENIDEDDMIKNKTQSVDKCNKSQLVKGYKPFIVLFILFLLVSLITSSVFVYYYFNSHSKRKLKDFYQVHYY